MASGFFGKKNLILLPDRVDFPAAPHDDVMELRTANMKKQEIKKKKKNKVLSAYHKRTVISIYGPKSSILMTLTDSFFYPVLSIIRQINNARFVC